MVSTFSYTNKNTYVIIGHVSTCRLGITRLSFNPEFCRNESEVESKLIVQYLLPELGYTPETWHQEVVVGSIRLDFLAFAAQAIPFVLDANSPLSVVMEAKHPKHNLDHYVSRFRHYLTNLNVEYGLITNGREIRIYHKLKDDIQIVFQCSGKEIHSNIFEIKNLIGRDSLKARYYDNDLKAKNSESNENDEFRRKHPMKIISVYHNKGGVGKTTTVVNLASALSKRNKRVLVIDLDSQANTTFATGLVKFDDEEFDNIQDCNILHVLQSVDFYPISEVARTSNFSNPEIYVVPAHIDLMNNETDLNSLDFSRMILIDKLEEVQDDYDVVLIDTPPSLNLYARIALIAADYLIIPSDLKPFANQGLKNVKEFIKNVDSFRRQIRKPPIKILGVLASKISTNSKFVQTTLKNRLQKISERYGIDVMDTVIYERDDLAKCAEKTLMVGDMEVADPVSVIDFKPHSTSAQEFELLAKEVLQKIGMS